MFPSALAPQPKVSESNAMSSTGGSTGVSRKDSMNREQARTNSKSVPTRGETLSPSGRIPPKTNHPAFVDTREKFSDPGSSTATTAWPTQSEVYVGRHSEDAQRGGKYHEDVLYGGRRGDGTVRKPERSWQRRHSDPEPSEAGTLWPTQSEIEGR